MSISSMTGFARQSGEKNFAKTTFSWYWEIKSVNGKALDVKTRLPMWLDGELSLLLKNMVAKSSVRGNISIFLDLKSVNSMPEVKINEELLNRLADKAINLQLNFGDDLRKASAAELLAFKGVVEIVEEGLSEEEKAILVQELLSGFNLVCDSLRVDRQNEGEKIKLALLDILNKVANIVAKIEGIAANQPQRLKDKLQQQMAELLDATVPVSEERMAQELALYVARADVREEIDRLQAHIKTAAEMLNSDEAVGRRLDFLCQELNREANTTCSKSFTIEQTNLGMELKTLIEQFREQVQNIE